nr:hypothetical protein [Methylomarinum sp. Ch1-1]MDP4522093.1 hypothetical protein [Methylomarinum sp. Ch1-1]
MHMIWPSSDQYFSIDIFNHADRDMHRETLVLPLLIKSGIRH